jgi:hypothetical protein
MKKLNKEESLSETEYFMKCLKAGVSVIHEETQLPHLGRTTIDLMIADDAPRKIALIRNNMLITDHVPGFYKRIPARFKDFVGIVEVVNEDGSQLIRSMEPPRHDSLSSDFLPTEEERRKGKLVLDKLSDELKKFIERHAAPAADDFGNASFMAEFFADEAGDDRGEKLGEEIDPNGNFVFQLKPIKLAALPKITLEAEIEEELEDYLDNFSDSETADNNPSEDNNAENFGAGGAGFAGGNSTNKTDDGKGHGDGTGGSGEKPKADRQRDKPKHPVQLKNVRIIKISNSEARIFATPTASGSALIRIHECGSDFDDPFEIISSNNGKLSDGALLLAMKNGERVDISLNLSRNIIGGLKVVASIPS